MIDSLSNRTGTQIEWAKSSKTQSNEKTAKNAMTDGFIERIKAYAKEDAKRGEYMSAGFTQMRLAHMKKNVSPDRSGPKADVMSAIQVALKEPHPMLQSANKKSRGNLQKREEKGRKRGALQRAEEKDRHRSAGLDKHVKSDFKRTIPDVCRRAPPA